MTADLEELASLYVLDQLEPRERATFAARLLVDAALAAFVRDLETTYALRLRALPQHAPSADLLARLEQRLDAHTPPFRENLPVAPSARPPSSISHLPSPAGFAGLFRWGLAAVIALGVATLAVQSLRRPPAAPLVVFVGLDAQRSTFAELPLQERAKDLDARFIQLASLAENLWEKPGRLPVKSSGAEEGNRGYALFDPGSNQGFIAIEQLPAPAQNQRYHLWIVDTATGQIRDAGTLPLAGGRSGLYSFTVAPTANATPHRPNFFVTVEESAAPSPSQPRGKVVLGDQRI